MKHEIVVIGTEPPCPRCALVKRRVVQAMGGRGDIVLAHWAYGSAEAQELGGRSGRHVGTAKDVAKACGLAVDWAAVSAAIDRKRGEARGLFKPADLWSPELDALLDGCRKAADGAGFYMTPILVMDGKVLHHGSVPSAEEIRRWVSAL